MKDVRIYTLNQTYVIAIAIPHSQGLYNIGVNLPNGPVVHKLVQITTTQLHHKH